VKKESLELLDLEYQVKKVIEAHMVKKVTEDLMECPAYQAVKGNLAFRVFLVLKVLMVYQVYQV
jgi:hypothetical protein